MKPVLLDTGFIVALLDRSENFHKTCARTIRELEAPLVTCEAVVTESCYLLRNLSGASEAVIENIAAGIFQIPFQLSRDTAGVKQLLRKYKDRKIDLAEEQDLRSASDLVPLRVNGERSVGSFLPTNNRKLKPKSSQIVRVGEPTPLSCGELRTFSGNSALPRTASPRSLAWPPRSDPGYRK
jgi:predicted nucleic acid-binding protein